MTATQPTLYRCIAGLTRRAMVLFLGLLGIGLCTLTPNPRVLQAQVDACTLLADVDGSGLVDVEDISLVAGGWHRPLDDVRLDVDGDKDVDVVDVMLVVAQWGETPTSPRLPGDGLVWAEGSTRKVRPTDPAPDISLRRTQGSAWVWDGCRIRLHAARNETEPFQLVITAGTQALTGVNVAVSDLTLAGSTRMSTKARATIDQAQITLYREAYATVSQPSDPYGYGLPVGTLAPGVIPDALIPLQDPYSPGQLVGAPFDVPIGQNQPIWIDLTVPERVSPGTYQGTVTVLTNEGSPVSLPLELVVWNFTLPAQPTLSINFTLDPWWTLPPQYGVSEGTSAFYDLVDKHYAALMDHRLSPLNLYREPAVSEDASGQVQLDWSQADPLYTYWLEARGLPAFFIPDVYDGGNDRYRIRDDSGRRYRQANFSDPTFVDKAKQYYTALRDHLVSQGWWDQAWTYPTDETEWVADEPLNNGLDGYQRLEDWAQLLKGVDPNYRITASSVYPIPIGPPDRGWPDLKGLVDDWNVVVQDADADPALWASRQALGETLSFYHNDWGDFLDYKATLHRGLGWVAYKHGAWAVTGWAVAAWIGGAAENIVNPWTSPVMPAYGYGGGALFWPGHQIEGDPSKNVDGPLPSIRLKLAREAVEDHDYLALLAAQTSPDYARALARGLIPRDYWDWDPSPDALYTLRDRIGRLLDSGASVPLATVQGQVTDAATSAPIEGVFVTDGESGALTDATGYYTLTIGLPTTSHLSWVEGQSYWPLPPKAPDAIGPIQARRTGIVPGLPTTATLSPTSDIGLSYSAPRYQTADRTVTVSAGGQVTQDVTLTRVLEESLILYSFETAGGLGEWEFANIVSRARVTDHATHGTRALKVEFNDSLASGEPYAGVGTFLTYDWSGYDALEFDVYNEGQYYTFMEVGVADTGVGWYPHTGGLIILLPNRSRHVVIPMEDIVASGVDLTRIEWLDITPETIMVQEGVGSWPMGPRTLYLDNLRLVRVLSK